MKGKQQIYLKIGSNNRRHGNHEARALLKISVWEITLRKQFCPTTRSTSATNVHVKSQKMSITNWSTWFHYYSLCCTLLFAYWERGRQWITVTHCYMGYPAVAILTIFLCFYLDARTYFYYWYFCAVSANGVCFWCYTCTSSFSCVVVFPSTGFLCSSVCTSIIFPDIIHHPVFI
jgi:hypothetical protein